MLRINDVVKLRKNSADKLPEDWKKRAYDARLTGRIEMIDTTGYHISFDGEEIDLVKCGHRDFES